MKKFIIGLLVSLVMIQSPVVKADVFDDVKHSYQTIKQYSKYWKDFKKLMEQPSTNVSYPELSSLEYQGEVSIDVPSTLVWDWESNKVDYSPLDELNRAGQATAYLTKDNVGTSDNRGSQMFLPTGYRKNEDHDKGHLIAYSLTFNLNEDGLYEKGHDGSLDNPKNLFTQTSFTNRGEMKQVENVVRKTLKRGEKVIYQVTPIFRENELMARGVWVQAVTKDKLLFSKYIFNVDDTQTFDYQTGKSN